MTAPLTPERLAEARVNHWIGPNAGEYVCRGCGAPWPCLPAALVAEVDRLEAKNVDGWVEVARLNLRLSDARTGADRLRAQVAAVLNRYSNDEPLEECEPEDVWRLFRDLRATLASGDEVQS